MIKMFVHRTALVFLLLVLPLIGHRELYAQSRGQRGSGSVTLAASIGKSDTEKRILVVLDDLDRNQRLRSLTVPAEDARLLRVLTEAINAKHVVELGTANGYSGIWFALALQATGGKLTTFEIDPQRAQQARENFERADVDHLITQVEGDAHQPLVRPGGLVALTPSQPIRTWRQFF